MAIKLNYGGLSGGTTLNLPENFLLDGLGTLEQAAKMIKLPGGPGGFNSADRSLSSKTVNLRADYRDAGGTANDNYDYLSELLAWLETAVRAGLRLYHRDDRFYWVDNVRVRHGNDSRAGSAVSNYTVELEIADPRAYDETETEVEAEITGAELEAETIDVSGLQADAQLDPVIRITPADGVLCSRIIFSWTAPGGGESVFAFNHLAMLGDASGHTWMEVDCKTGLVTFTSDDGVTTYNAAPYYSGAFPVLLEAGQTVTWSYQGGDATVTITGRKAYFA